MLACKLLISVAGKHKLVPVGGRCGEDFAEDIRSKRRDSFKEWMTSSCISASNECGDTSALVVDVKALQHLVATLRCQLCRNASLVSHVGGTAEATRRNVTYRSSGVTGELSESSAPPSGRGRGPRRTRIGVAELFDCTFPICPVRT